MNYKWDISNISKKFKEKAKIKKGSNTIRLCSIVNINLKETKKFLNKLKIKSKIYKRKNGLGKNYYELSIYGKENLNKLININLISNKNERKIKKN